MNPAVILPTVQRGAMDCGVVCVQMLTSEPYEVVRDVALKIEPTLYTRGLYRSQVARIARTFGVDLRCRPRPHESDDVAILRIRLNDGSCHFVLLFHGVIADPTNAGIWHADIYLANKGRLAGCLVPVQA